MGTITITMIANYLRDPSWEPILQASPHFSTLGPLKKQAEADRRYGTIQAAVSPVSESGSGRGFNQWWRDFGDQVVC